MKKVIEKRKFNVDNRIYTLIVYRRFSMSNLCFMYFWRIEENDHIIFENKIAFSSTPECQDNIKYFANVLEPIVVNYIL